MKFYNVELLLDDSQAAHFRRQQIIIDFWNELHTCDDSGATTWEVLDSLENAIAECLYQSPPDFVQAESLTAKAAILIAGFNDL